MKAKPLSLRIMPVHLDRLLNLENYNSHLLRGSSKCSMTFLERFKHWEHFMRRRGRQRQQNSLLVPLGGDDPSRERNSRWLQAYWTDQIPDVEIVIGRDKKSERGLFSRAFASRHFLFLKPLLLIMHLRSLMEILLSYLIVTRILPGDIILHCADRLRAQRRVGCGVGSCHILRCIV